MKISSILDKIDEKQLFVPAFQREYVWKRDDAKSLIDSLIKEYPTGTMLTWETANPPELKGPHKYNQKQGSVRLLLDGQQRITTLYMLIRGELPPYYTAAEITEDTRGLHVNLQTLELSYYSKARMDNNPFWQNITDVFKGAVSAFDLQAAFASSSTPISMDSLKALNDNVTAISRIKDREFPEQTIPIKASIREAIDIFYKVNASGVALTDAELALAQISGFWPQARDLFKVKLLELEKQGFGFRLDFIVYALLGCLHHMASDMRKLHDEQNNGPLREAWKRLDEQVLDYVVNLLKSRAYVDHVDEISSPYALIPIIVFCFNKRGKHPSDLEIKKLVKWFYYSQFRARYVSQVAQKLDRDLRIIQESSQPFDDLLQVIAEERPLEISPNEFEGRGISHPLFSMVTWYAKSLGAVCLTTGITLRQNMGKKYQIEYDHIFPFSKLKARGYGKENRLKYSLAQELTNRALLTQIANRSKSATDPNVYLTDVSKKFPGALATQCIPSDPMLWTLDHYEEFLAVRRAALATGINHFLNGITATSSVSMPATIEDLIREGESDELEFKSTLRWDLREAKLSQKMEEVIVKTVAALGNAQGGTLIIGVADDGQVLGLSHDMLTLKEANRDHFELHLRNLLSQNIGPVFATNRVQVRFHTVENEDVCQVDVAKVSEPIIVTAKDKNGQPIQKFYVRNGNASIELSMSDFSDYSRERFR
ncbi:DUF262 domain-containing protein [Aestuariivirga sp.]|uniref:GmrSD restriction endonuclease domain-containing protein n=1 Tax=Aestuariivirga sp. TaxID=2650926 RepID=UPI0039E5F09D